MIGQTISHYKILEKLGEGGMGVVYKAQDTRLDRMVALKFLPSHLSTNKEANRRFIHEAKAASALDHRNICTVYDIGQGPDGGMFIAMAYYEGDTLWQRLERGALDTDEALDIVAQIASGLGDAHEHDIVHRDLKPANVVITQSGEAKILDFGLVKLAGQTRVTKMGTTIGTVSYMSPEQAAGDEVDGRSDIFSLGSVMYELLTGHQAFPGEREAVILSAIKHDDPVPLQQHSPSLPAGLQEIVGKALAKNAADRYQSAADLLTDLGAFRTGRSRKTRKKIGARVVLLAIAIALVSVGGYAGYKTLWSSKSPTVVKGDEEMFTVAVAPFAGLNADAMEEGRVMQALVERKLLDELRGEKMVRILGNGEITEVPQSHEEAKALGRELKATMVLWGRVLMLRQEVEIQPYVTMVSRIRGVKDRSEDALRANLAEPNQLALRKAKAEDVGNIALNLAGAFYRTRDPDKSLALLQRISPPTSESLRRQGGVYYDRKDWIEAERFFSAAVRRDSTSSHAHNSMGALRYHQGRGGDEQARWFMKAILLDSTSTNPLSNLALVRAEQGRYGEAVRLLEKAIRLDPSDAEAYADLGWVRYDQRQYEEAVRLYEKSIQLDSTYADAYIYLGRVRDQQGQYEEAERLYKKAIELESDHFWAHNNLGVVYRQQGRHDEAVSWCEKAIQLDSTNAYPYRNLGHVRYEQGQYEEAARLYEKSIQLDSTYANAYNSLGRVRDQQGQYEEAERLYKKAIELDSTHFWARNNLGVVRHRQGRYDEAVSWFEKAMQLDSTNAYPYRNLGRVRYDQGQYGEAADWFELAIQVDSTYADAYGSLGQARHQQGQHEEAERLYKKAIELDSDHFWAHSNLGVLYRDQGQYDEAVSWYKKAIQLDSTNTRPYGLLGVMQNQRGRHEDAVRWFELAIRQDSTYAEAYLRLVTTHMTMGAYGDAAAILRLRMKRSMGDTYDALWYFICLRSIGEVTEAEAHASGTASMLESDAWIAPVARFYAGEITEEAALRAAESDDEQTDRMQKCEAYYYVGMAHLVGVNVGVGFVADTTMATEYFEKCLETNVTDFFEYKWAKNELERIRNP